jgi:hypothetical protein
MRFGQHRAEHARKEGECAPGPPFKRALLMHVFA